jgi:tetratricopeptide (TPR) repeat protein
MNSVLRFGQRAGLLGLVLFASSTAFGQTGAISGKVKGPDGSPLKDAQIVIVRTDIKGNYKVKTNKKGEYLHVGLPLGTYDVTCEVNGQMADQMKGVRTRLGDPIEVNFDLAQMAARQQQQQAAVQKAAEAGKLDEKDEALRGMSKEQREALEKQMKERSESMKKNKELNDAFNGGMTALAGKQYDAAVESFNRAVTAMDPKQPQPAVWSNMAEAYKGLASTKTGDEKTAALNKGAEAWAKAIEIKPDDAGYHNNYALMLVDAKKYKEAEEELNKAAALAPTQAGMYFYNLGAVLTNNNQLEAAGQAFKRAVDADPKHADAQYQYGMYLVSKAQTTADGKVQMVEGTREAFQAYLDLKPTGQFADSAKGILQTMESTVSTKYENPDAKTKKTPAKKK